MTDRAFYARQDVSAKRRGQILILAPLALINIALFANRLDWAFALFAGVCGMLALTQFIAIRRGHVVVTATDEGLRNFGAFGSRFARWEELTAVDINPDKRVGTIEYTTTVGKMDHRMNIATGFLDDDEVHALIDLISARSRGLIVADPLPQGGPMIAAESATQ